MGNPQGSKEDICEWDSSLIRKGMSASNYRWCFWVAHHESSSLVGCLGSVSLNNESLGVRGIRYQSYTPISKGNSNPNIEISPKYESSLSH